MNGIRLANRACQLESSNLDQELNRIIEESVEALHIPRLVEEAKLIAKLYIHGNLLKGYTTIGMRTFHISLYDSEIRYGGALVQIRPNKVKLLFLVLLNLVTPYLLQKTYAKLIVRGFVDRLKLPWINVANAETLFKLLRVVNFMIFLRVGRYPSLQHRLLGILQGISDESNGTALSARFVQMELIDRENMWRVLAEFLTVSTLCVKRQWLEDKCSTIASLFHVKKRDTRSMADEISEGSNGNCAICSKQPFNPQVIGCRHSFCYYCVMSNFESAGGSYKCPSCNFLAKDISQAKCFSRGHSLA